MSYLDKKSQRIENWKLVGVLDRECMAPEQVQTVMVGEIVIGQTRIPVQTSEVIWFSHTSGIAETRNTMYNLGVPDPDWIQWLTIHGYTLENYAIEKSV